MSEEITANATPDLAGDSVKPKRQLTEAQRLAFLKAREARARNIALRREQKMAEETTAPAPEKKPRAKRAPKRDDGSEGQRQRQRVNVKVAATEPVPESQPEPEPDVAEKITKEIMENLEGSDHTDEPIASSLPDMPDPHVYAKLVADIIYDKLNSEIVDVPPPPKPKLKRVNRNGRRPHPASTAQADEPKTDEVSGGHIEAKGQGQTIPPAAPTPMSTEPSLAWM